MTVRDLWYKTDRKTGVKTQSKRHGVGSRWQVNYTDLEGTRTSTTFDTREEAKLFDAGVKVKKNDGTLISADKREILVEELWEPWLATKSHVAEKTRKDYISYWNVHVKPVWGKKRLSEIQEHQVIAWVAALTSMKGVPAGGEPRPPSGSAKKKIADMFGSMLTRAVKMKIIPSNPLDGSSKPRVGKSERRYLNIEEVDSLLYAAKKPAVKLILEVLLRTGLRVGEAKD